jgi:membrane associated rhomboid family serine protease
VITLVFVFFIPFFFEIPAVVFLGFWFVTQLFSGTLALVGATSSEDVAWWAHAGGFVTGMILLPLFKQSRKQYRRFYADEYWPW